MLFKIKIIFFVALLSLKTLSVRAEEVNMDFSAGLFDCLTKSHDKGLPLYSWSLECLSVTLEKREWASQKNGSYNKKLIEYDKKMIDLVVKDSEWHASSLIAKQEKALSGSNPKMLNGYGSASKTECYLNEGNQLLFLTQFYPPSTKRVVVDIGSGWGTCARPLALLGYTVYSVDLDQDHIEYQKQHFCDKLEEDSFLYNYWKTKEPTLLEAENFARYCEKSKENIKYIKGNFAYRDVYSSSIADKKWDIVIALDSLHFMNESERETTFHAINEHLKPEGLFVSKINHQSEGLLSHDFALEDMYEKHFSKYKILNMWQSVSSKDRLYGITVMKP